jgi:hypothetical protein
LLRTSASQQAREAKLRFISGSEVFCKDGTGFASKIASHRFINSTFIIDSNRREHPLTLTPAPSILPEVFAVATGVAAGTGKENRAIEEWEIVQNPQAR